MGADSMELAHVDYSFKPIKPIVGNEQPVLEQALLVTHIPLFYGAMPNLGLYSQPDGPFPNPSELLPQGKITEARDSYEKSVEAAIRDMVVRGAPAQEIAQLVRGATGEKIVFGTLDKPLRMILPSITTPF
jgi:dimethylamine--corrinoid protein Co-methyltransferase